MVPTTSSSPINRHRLLRLTIVFGLALMAVLLLGQERPVSAAGSTFPRADLSVVNATGRITGMPGMLINRVTLTATTYDASPDNHLHPIGVTAYDSSPKGVILASFDVLSMTGDSGGYNAITWETASELNLLGFNLWRGTSLDVPDVKLNSFVIPAQTPGGTDGAKYSYDDLGITNGPTYYYWLEEVELSGEMTRHGPVAALGDVPTAITLTTLQATSRTTDLPAPLLGLFGAATTLALLKRHRAK